jgi:ferrous iron transport protein B
VTAAAVLRAVLAGNPNVGKTTLFNALTGSSAKVTNYPGVTVDIHVGTVALDDGAGDLTLTDLPGTYSLIARSREEQIAINSIAGMEGCEVPQAVVVCVDASQPARSLYLLLQCQELGARCVVALTMADEAKTATPSPDKLSKLLGCDVVQINAITGAGLPALRKSVAAAARLGQAQPVWRWRPSADLQSRIDAMRTALPPTWPANDATALWALLCIDQDDELVGVSSQARGAAMQPPLPTTLDDEASLAR